MRIFVISFLFTICNPSAAQLKVNKTIGTEIITSGGQAADSLFTGLLGGPDAKVIFISTAASSLRSDERTIWNPDEEENKEQYKQDLLKRFNLNNIKIFHTRNHEEANTEKFIAPLYDAKVIWISGGNPGRFMSVYKGTLLEKELNKTNLI